MLRSLEDADGYELRTPIAKLGPTKLTYRVKKMVLDYYAGDVEIFDALEVAIEKQEAPPPKRTSHTRRGFADEDRPFVELAMRLLEDGRAKNANEAIGLIENGLWKEISPEERSFHAAVAGGGNYESKRSRLYGQVNECWKAHLEEGKLLKWLD